MSKKSKSKGIEGGEQILTIPVHEIRPFPGQPRDWFDPKTMEELAASISSAGQQVPISVTRVKQIGRDGIRFELIDGERRLRAIKKLGFPTIKAIVKVVTDIEQQFENSVIVNFNRDGHSPIETARAIKRLKANGQSTEMIAKKLGRSVPWAHQHLNILKLNPLVIEMMHPALPESERLLFSMGILLFGITPSELQLELAQKIVKEGMSTARAKVMVNKLIFEKGLKKSERHTPRKEFKKIQGFFERTGESLKILSEKSDDTLRKILMSRERDERNTLLKNAELVQRLSAQIRDFVRKAS